MGWGTKKGVSGMQAVPVPSSERFVTASESIVLECRCGEKLILLGYESDWQKEGRTNFECGGCGENIFVYQIRVIQDARRLLRKVWT